MLMLQVMPILHCAHLLQNHFPGEVLKTKKYIYICVKGKDQDAGWAYTGRLHGAFYQHSQHDINL